MRSINNFFFGERAEAKSRARLISPGFIAVVRADSISCLPSLIKWKPGDGATDNLSGVYFSTSAQYPSDDSPENNPGQTDKENDFFPKCRQMVQHRVIEKIRPNMGDGNFPHASFLHHRRTPSRI